MEITCYRDQELAREARYLPSNTYNLALTLLACSTTGNVFVPIRSMQCLAILDAEEWVFLEGTRKCWVDIARSFNFYRCLFLRKPSLRRRWACLKTD